MGVYLMGVYLTGVHLIGGPFFILNGWLDAIRLTGLVQGVDLLLFGLSRLTGR
jgi:hypothetical protein